MTATRKIAAALIATALLAGCASEDSDDDAPQGDVTNEPAEDDESEDEE